jgi:hypothetical protein
MKNVHHKLGNYAGGNIWYLKNSSGTFIHCNRLRIAKLGPDGTTWETLSPGWKVTTTGSFELQVQHGDSEGAIFSLLR